MTDSVLPSWEHLETLPGTQFYKLYRSPPSALAIFRKRLSSLAKSFVMTLLYMQKPIAAKDLELFVKPSGSRSVCARNLYHVVVTEKDVREFRHAIDLLHRYHVIKDVTVQSNRGYALTQDFARSLRSALSGSSRSNTFGSISKLPIKDAVSVIELDNFARRQWEGILGYMVGSTAAAADAEERLPPPSKGVIQILQAGHLIELFRDSPSITKEGFAFVLQDVNTQIWALLFLYVENSNAFGMDKVDVLSTIFLISSLDLGVAYSLSSLTGTQQRVLPSLAALGIVFQPLLSDDEIADYFYPTRLATTLTSDSSATLTSTNATLGSSLAPAKTGAGGGTSSSSAANSETAQGFIIVETNYRVYAYTNSPLQIALLSLFVTLRSRHPNLVTGKMTKMSVQRAVHSGITAEQIISYLSTHAHPQMRRHAQAQRAKNTSMATTTTNPSASNPTAVATKADSSAGEKFNVLPATVLDQIHLWQIERDRMTTTSGFLMKDWQSQLEYERVCKYADETGVLVWKSDKKRMFFVTQVKGIQSFMADRSK